jgi:hypothetical protein
MANAWIGFGDGTGMAVEVYGFAPVLRPKRVIELPDDFFAGSLEVSGTIPVKFHPEAYRVFRDWVDPGWRPRISAMHAEYARRQRARRRRR